ncbi:uncharacterized protein LOC110848873 [Folsomia candida]|uniref:Putative oxidoreductase dhs-27 n=1 Tax=Folsomia candida TaxID=158441 RepID=A0A226EFB7_FOLCA|nr:uncharacterized protein LOC110848873 [Folsomia candida]XP_021951904.1 uncharacterized protein LOC110848873 [Folsomia candida]OXA55948.1 putative oxidoreductase dhs-27 [Folsomia candida]
MEHPPVPLSSEGVTPSWLSQLLRTKISTHDFQKETNIQSGSGFLSSMVRVTCKSEDGQNFNLIVKLLPEDSTMLELTVSEEFDKTEVNFYKQVVTDLVNILPDLNQYLCHSYYEHVQHADEEKHLKYTSVLVMEDLKPRGYYTINFAGEESKQQFEQVLEFMAKFHFAGMVLETKKNAKLCQVYNFLQGVSDSGPSMFYEMSKAGFVEIIQLLSDHASPPPVIEAYRKMAPHSDTIIKKVQEASKEFACLIHGDLWSNNCLFNDDPQFHTKIIDWQLLGYKDPNYDVAVTIVSSIPVKQLTKEKVTESLKHYYETFLAECAKSGGNLRTRDWDQFCKFFYTWGMSYTMLWFLMASDPFSLNVPRLVKIYEFLILEANVHEFLLSQVEEV